MITEDYVSFETALLLKKKGFEQIGCQKQYNTQGDLCTGYCYGPVAPTLQMAMKWLRKVHNKNIIVDMISLNEDCYVLWTFNIYYNKNYKIIWGTKQPKYNTYEEAAEAAIKYCLENLI